MLRHDCAQSEMPAWIARIPQGEHGAFDIRHRQHRD